MMMDKVAKFILKAFTLIFLFSVVISAFNIIPYYMTMNQAANDILMRAAINNYVLDTQVQDVIKQRFNLSGTASSSFKSTGTGTMSNLTYTDNGGIYVFGCVSDQKIRDACFSGNNQVAIGNSGYANPTRKLIINQGSTFDPKTNDSHTELFRKNYGGAQRGDTVSVRLESKIKFTIIFLGYNRTIGVPLSVTKSAPAMYYYRI